MSDHSVFNVLKVLSGVLTVASVMIATATNLPDLGLSRQTIAVLAIVQAGITATVAFLPQLQKSAGNVRGDSTDDQ